MNKSPRVLATGMIAMGSALAVGLCAVATGIAQSRIGAAGCGAIAEKPETGGTVILLVAIPETMVILMTAFGDVELAVKGIRAGAFDFILKPWQNAKLHASILSALSMKETRREKEKYEQVARALGNDDELPFMQILGDSPVMEKLKSTIRVIAPTDARSGGERIEYSINGGVAKTANPIKGLAPGNYHIVVKAFDVLGNVSSEEIKYSIEK